MPRHRFDIADRKATIEEELRRLAGELGATPTIKDYMRLAKCGYTHRQAVATYGSWNAAVRSAGLTPNPKDRPPSARLSDKELVDEFVRVANDVGKLPSMQQFTALSRYTHAPYLARYGTWLGTKRHIASAHAERFAFSVAVPAAKRPQRGRRKTLAISSPLKYEPTNEQETIALFVFLAGDLGYEIESLQTEFPDAILLKDGARVYAEFEFLASNYAEHAHPQDPKYLCVCWRRDSVDLGPVRILSLEEHIRSRIETA